MYPLFFIAPIAIIVIGYMVVRSPSNSSKPLKPSSPAQSSNDVSTFFSDDNDDQSSMAQIHAHRHSHSHSHQDNNTIPTGCNEVASIDTSSSSSSNWDSGSSSCNVDSSPSPSVDTSSY